ncbi:hypothetical protein [Zobellia sp. B3R18]|uniref:hypothetical protein n=1 Tax=Zobellia sp. B3R18 TaxID=2841568 RepID=UPI001C073872|nr:hypothetical protein [Zobellia sp. B3R18]MBU2973110.1 hypothetical protein [Zobellia sp. B3R18]
MLWFSLLDYWGFKKEPQGSGLSIPFLVGAELQFGDNCEFSIENLLSEFIDIVSEYVIAIRFCDTIGELVCCLEKHTVQEKNYYRTRFGNLVLISDYFDEVKTPNQASLLLHKKYIQEIEHGKYSLESGYWRPFSQEDICMIKNVLKQ